MRYVRFLQIRQPHPAGRRAFENQGIAMKTSLTVSIAAGLFLTVINGASAQNLVYGQTYNIQNGYANWTGGYLDTRAAGCQDNVYCVSTASSSRRDGKSGTWMIKSATRIADGTPVNSFDRIYLVNQYGTPTYLDTRGRGCQDNNLCVSTAAGSDRDSHSGTWLIIKDQWQVGPVNAGDTVRLMNGYADWSGGYLDTRAAGCQSNVLCVSTSATYNRDTGSTTWRMQPQ